ncbi:MAG: hypothetical protein GXO07_03945 [Crenarchaeota archaeon]|nr:hypothetical protein [Thermoproteota archaeon]
MMAHTTIGPLARGTSVLDAMKNMVLSGGTRALLEGAPLKLLDAEQILRALALSESALDVIEVLRSDADTFAYDVPVVDDEYEALKVIAAKDVSAVMMKGGSLVDPILLLAENKEKLENVKLSEVLDQRPPLIDPLADVLKALRHSLVYPLSGHVIVGQKRPFGTVTPLKFLKYFTLESVISQIEIGENGPLERAVGDLAESLPGYPTPDAKLADVVPSMIDNKTEVLPVVKDKKYVGVVRATAALLPLLG